MQPTMKLRFVKRTEIVEETHLSGREVEFPRTTKVLQQWFIPDLSSSNYSAEVEMYGDGEWRDVKCVDESKVVSDKVVSGKPDFCDSHCTWRDHHPECKLSKEDEND